MDYQITTAAFESHNALMAQWEADRQISQSAHGLESIMATIQAAGPMSFQTKRLVQAQLTKHLTHVGIETIHLNDPTQFALYGGLSLTEGVLRLTTESIDETLSNSLEGLLENIYSSISNGLSKTFQKAEDFFKDFYQSTEDLANHAEALHARLSNATLEEPKKPGVSTSRYHLLHYKGNTDKHDVLEGFRNMLKLNTEIFPVYQEAVAKFYDSYFEALQSVAEDANDVEKTVIAGKSIETFLNTLTHELDNILKIGNDHLEISGGKMFKRRREAIESVPALVDANNVTPDSRGSFDALTKREIEEVIHVIQSNAKVVKSWWGRWQEFRKMLDRASQKAAFRSDRFNQSALHKFTTRLNSKSDLKSFTGTLIEPLHQLAWHSLSVSRAMLQVADGCTALYEEKKKSTDHEFRE